MGLAFDCEVHKFARYVDFLDDFLALQKGLYLGVCLGCGKNHRLCFNNVVKDDSGLDIVVG